MQNDKEALSPLKHRNRKDHEDVAEKDDEKGRAKEERSSLFISIQTSWLRENNSFVTCHKKYKRTTTTNYFGNASATVPYTLQQYKQPLLI